MHHSKEQSFPFSDDEFSRRTDSDFVLYILTAFEDFWPNEIDNFRLIINENSFIDLACGNHSSCHMAIRGLSKVMKRSPINSYIGVDRFNIDENSKSNLIEEMEKSDIYFLEDGSLNQVPINQLYPNLVQNITLIHSDMLDFLRNLPPQSIRVLSIGGFSDCICNSENPYRKQVIKEIQRTLAPDSYFLCAWSLLDISCDRISEVNKSDNHHWNSPSYLKGYNLYKSSK